MGGVAFGGVALGGVDLGVVAWGGVTLGGVAFGGVEDTIEDVFLAGDLVTIGGDVGLGVVGRPVVLCMMLLMMDSMLLKISIMFGVLGDISCPG